MNKYLDLTRQKENLINYLTDKIKNQDWHAVADAAMDLRELEIEIKHAKAN